MSKLNKKTASELKKLKLPTHRKPTHPGEVIQKEFLDELGISQRTLAKQLKISLAKLNRIINKKQNISIDVAIRLNIVLGPSIKFWMGLQQDLDLYTAVVNYYKKDPKLKKG